MNRKDALGIIRDIMVYGSEEAADEARAISKEELRNIAKAARGEIDLDDLTEGDLDRIRYGDLISRLKGIKAKSNLKGEARDKKIREFIKMALDGEISDSREVIIDETDQI